MKHQAVARPAAALLGLLALAGALAQGPPVMTDVQPPPAEDRSSSGAVELEKSPVRAKRDSSAVLPSQRMGAAPARPGTPSANTPTQKRAQQAEKRAADAAELRRQGAGSLTPN